MKRYLATILVLATGGFSAACATLMQGTTQEVGISSQPTAAAVTIDNEEFGTTPVVADLSRKDLHTVAITMDGYEPYEMTFSRSTSGWVWGNLVFGGLIGLAVDAISGGLYKLSPEQVEAELQRTDVAGTIEASEEGIYLFVTLEPRVDWERLEAAALQRRW